MKYTVTLTSQNPDIEGELIIQVDVDNADDAIEAAGQIIDDMDDSGFVFWQPVPGELI